MWLCIIVVLVMITYWVYSQGWIRINIEPFTMSTCPNCFKRDRLACFQCTDQCVWCWKSGMGGVCVPQFDQNSCDAVETRPDPIKDANMYLPGQRKWWDWSLDTKQRDGLRDAVNISQSNIPTTLAFY